MHLGTNGKGPDTCRVRPIQRIRKYLNLDDLKVIFGPEFYSSFTLSSVIISLELFFERSGGSKEECQGAARVGLLHAEGMTQELRVTPAHAVFSPVGYYPMASEDGRQSLITGSINNPQEGK